MINRATAQTCLRHDFFQSYDAQMIFIGMRDRFIGVRWVLIHVYPLVFGV